MSETVARFPTAWRKPFAILCLAVLMLPVLAMTVTREVRWGPGDVVAAAALLALLGLGIELAMRVGTTQGRRALLALGAIACALVVWAELAVGLFD